jgi:environmental stress-induced protein Ves
MAMIIRANDQPAATWRGGTTRTIYAYPADTRARLASAHLWAGTATIERDGPYSVFTNRTRIHLPVRGNGLHLHFQDPAETIVLPTFAQATFAGDRPLNVTLIDGPVAAFNLFFHPTVQAELQLLHLAPSVATTIPATELTSTEPTAAEQASVQILYAVNGCCIVETGDGETAALQSGDAFVHEDGQALRVDCIEQGGVVVLATLVWAPMR